MIDPASKIREHMEIVGADGQHVGVVDKVENGRLKLTRNDPQAGGQHHFVHLDTVDTVEDGRVRLTLTAGQALDEWAGEAASGGPSGGKGGARDGGGGGAFGGGLRGSEPT